jgi:hypothetical protein
MILAKHLDDPLEHGWREEQIDKIGIELRPASFHQFRCRFLRAPR